MKARVLLTFGDEGKGMTLEKRGNHVTMSMKENKVLLNKREVEAVKRALTLCCGG